MRPRQPKDDLEETQQNTMRFMITVTSRRRFDYRKYAGDARDVWNRFQVDREPRTLSDASSSNSRTKRKPATEDRNGRTSSSTGSS